jgi:RNase P subunit RPR2
MRSGAEFVSQEGIKNLDLNYIVERLKECADEHDSCRDCPDLKICVAAYDERCSLGIDGGKGDFKKLGKDAGNGTGKDAETGNEVIVQATGIDHKKTIKTARKEHRCHRCGGVIKTGDSFTMRMDYEGGSLKFCPVCLGCDGRFEKEKGRK